MINLVQLRINPYNQGEFNVGTNMPKPYILPYSKKKGAGGYKLQNKSYNKQMSGLKNIYSINKIDLKNEGYFVFYDIDSGKSLLPNY